ncbi:MAG: bifunctional diaminohydroxyphosphoribosylaminopyrimidine deaminase/5-amino-6-(5-phosphoribosylamino)uracil reductase RibD [Proteobacteria bacterium]|nr:bifunctional diaminohydroxyphosphoribosylaminopyrimidine deaminase/5-amino-6-(5-phosphoribosylamino)uracil reductase RibD [Pseudomonadota bacterium]
MNTDVEYMQRALQLARKGRYTTDPNPRVGCVIVRDGTIVGEGWHQCTGEPHAEIHALEQAGDAASGATVYVTLEPCSHTGKTPPCANALVKGGVKKVVAAMLDPNPLVAGRGLIRLHQAGIETDNGLLEAQALELNRGFIKRMKAGRPFVRVKLAMSLDGRTAMASGESKWISSDASRIDVQRMRAESSAILTGMGTVVADDPSMDVRLSVDELGIASFADEVRQPLRVVLDSHFAMPEDVKIIAQDGRCRVYTTVAVGNQDDYPFKIKTVAAERDGRVDLPAMLKDLGKEEINNLHVEAGSVLCGALLQEGLVDEIVIYMAPHLMGDRAKGLFSLPGLNEMKDRVSLEIKDVRAVGQDIRITAQPVAAGSVVGGAASK